jgi:ubiquitin-protein ligase
MTGILERRFQRFEEINNINLKEYFGIIDTPQRIVNIDATHNNEAVICTVSFKEVNKMVNIECLPMDIIREISSYLNCYLTIKTKIVYPQDYPFDPPQWSLVCVRHNIESRLNLKEYYEYLVETHNNQYSVDWSPAIHINVDILDFIRRLNNFDYLLECR